MTSTGPTNIALYGHFGAGNLGNECTLQAVLEALRRRLPAARLLCICTDPADVRSRHAVEAVQSMARPAAWSAAASPGSPAGEAAPAAPARSAWDRIIGRLLRGLLQRVPAELSHWGRAFRALRGVDLLIVPGTQIVSDYLCGPSGWPYDLFKWTLLARLRGARLVYLSIGVGPVDHPLSRWLIRRSLQRADYRSYRDEVSRRYAESLGVADPPARVLPDLAFGLGSSEAAASDAAAPLPHARPEPRVVGLGLKDYYGPEGHPASGSYRGYLDTMAAFAGWLLGQGYAVRLLIGDLQYDVGVQRDLAQRLRGQGLPHAGARLVAEPAQTVAQLLRQLGEAEVVVSPRFHNLVLALELGTPVLALSDHAKLDSLLSEIGLDHYCLPLDRLDAAQLIARFRELIEDDTRVRRHVRERIAAHRAALEAQYSEALRADVASRLPG